MATAALTTDLSTNVISACDSTTADGTWSGVSAGLGTADPTQLEGSGRLDFVVKSTTDSQNDIYFDPTASIDLSGEHLRFMLFTALKAVVGDVASLGIELWLSDGSNGAWYTVSGSDKYIGGWETLVLNTSATESSGTPPTLSAITQIGIIFRLDAAAKNVDTVWLDYITFGNGFQKIAGGTSGDEIGFAEIDAQDVYYKVFENIGGIYRARGELIFGDSAGTSVTWFKDAGKVLFFDDLVVSSTLYKIKGVGNATGVTHLDFSGIFFGTAGASFLVDFTDSNLTSVTLDGTTFQGGNNVNLGSAVSGDGTIVDGCDAVDPNGASLDGMKILNSTASGTAEGSLMVNVDTEAEACVNMKFEKYTGATTYAIFVAASVTEFDMDNWTFDDPNNTTSYALYWAGTVGTLTINALNGTNLVTAGCTSGGGTVTVVNSVALTINIEDTDGDPIENVKCAIYKTSDASELMNELSTALGVATQPFPYTVPTAIYWKTRLSSSGGTRYKYKQGVGLIDENGFSTTVILEEDPFA